MYIKNKYKKNFINRDKINKQISNKLLKISHIHLVWQCTKITKTEIKIKKYKYYTDIFNKN